ncbi:hypothetical protein ACHAXS_009627 [Conticribra weissflogii]
MFIHIVSWKISIPINFEIIHVVLMDIWMNNVRYCIVNDGHFAFGIDFDGNLTRKSHSLIIENILCISSSNKCAAISFCAACLGSMR